MTRDGLLWGVGGAFLRKCQCNRLEREKALPAAPTWQAGVSTGGITGMPALSEEPGAGEEIKAGQQEQSRGADEAQWSRAQARQGRPPWPQDFNPKSKGKPVKVSEVCDSRKILYSLTWW